MRLLLVTDAWFPQLNGVVRALSTVLEHFETLFQWSPEDGRFVADP